MLPDPGVLPEWLLDGLLLGIVATLVVTVLFFVVDRWVPGPARSSGPVTDGDRRRREELRAYLRAIDEAFVEDHAVAGSTVAFYLPDHDVAITYDARAYYDIERGETVPVLLEYEMPGRHLGARLPFEVPDIDFRTGPTPDEFERSLGAYRELGLSPPASPSDVESAYRDRVKEVHPDLGGDRDAFRRVHEAYTTAKRDSAD